MRAREILEEDYNQSLKSDLENLLVAAKGSGATELKTKDLANRLYNMGYSVDVNSIISLLSDSPVVINATPEDVIITPPEGISASQNPAALQDTAARVSDMAKKATKIG